MKINFFYFLINVKLYTCYDFYVQERNNNILNFKSSYSFNYNLLTYSSNYLSIDLSKSYSLRYSSDYLLDKSMILIYSNIPFFIVSWGEIWRLLIGPFIPDNIFALILDIVTVLTIINYYENTKGSLKFTILFF